MQDQERQIHPWRVSQEASDSASLIGPHRSDSQAPQSHKFLRNDLRSMVAELRIDMLLLQAQEAVATRFFGLAETKASLALSLAQKEFQDFEPLHARCHFHIGVARYHLHKTKSAYAELEKSRPIKELYPEGVQVEILIDKCEEKLYGSHSSCANQRRKSKDAGNRLIESISGLGVRNLAVRLRELLGSDVFTAEHYQALLQLRRVSQRTHQDANSIDPSDSSSCVAPLCLTPTSSSIPSEQYEAPPRRNTLGSTDSYDRISQRDDEMDVDLLLARSLADELDGMDNPDFEDDFLDYGND